MANVRIQTENSSKARHMDEWKAQTAPQARASIRNIVNECLKGSTQDEVVRGTDWDADIVKRFSIPVNFLMKRVGKK